MSGKVHKVAVIGAPGAGKTTCIRTVSDVPPVSTAVPDAEVPGDPAHAGTVTLDYGEVLLNGDDGRVLLYGLPGQEGFGYMFDAVRGGLLGALVLIDASHRRAVLELARMLARHREGLRRMPFIVALNKSESMADVIAERCRDVVRGQGLTAPVMTIDARRREDVVHLLELLVVIHEFGFGFEREDAGGKRPGSVA
jgi:signal recognition particle receptor subunit beta